MLPDSGFAGDESDGDGDDDIARFERQCAERARAEGLLLPQDADEDMFSDDEGAIRQPKRADKAPAMDPFQVRAVGQTATMYGGATSSSAGDTEWKQRCSAMQDKLSRREAELAQARADLEALQQSDRPGGDPGADLKQKYIELTKKSRRMQVTMESQRTRITQLEQEVSKPREEARRQAEEAVLQSNNNAMLGEGAEDFKNKFLVASNSLQHTRQEVQELKAQLQKQRKVLLKELGNEEQLEKALSVADDPADVSWRGRAAQISQLQRQLKELKDQVKSGAATMSEEPSEADGPQTPQRPAASRAAAARPELAQAAERRREELERLQEEVEKLRKEEADSKRKRDALKSRTNLLEGQLRELKTHVQTLIRKSEDDDALVTVLRRQISREAGGGGGGSSGMSEEARRENEELRSQMERQAQIILKLRQQSMASTVENGSGKLGPQSSMSEKQLLDRVRYLEAENMRFQEQARMRDRGGEQLDANGRPFSSESTIRRKAKLNQMDEQNEDMMRRHRSECQVDSSPSCRGSSRGSSRGPPLGSLGDSGLLGVAG
eukprot:CAMPEP_0206563322 /NCGR_PEP_ID=MMETSP0325_2-20121206/22776_1 /ASSEMBLY_ACC=CAM_ASM_000347 /TAXON_ID=2866 /ORGANISM="Crypthecodinium cohnii, Strain Seligo" /LENGTH=551 /DNA_ID=CAMNT_0054065703 /DNA_START=135 /DNA_END=1790 /DNA_ORIENTATION=-